MKKVITIFGLIITTFLLICYFIPSRQLNLDDCLELGLCAEGLELKDNGKPYIMTKEYRINKNNVWYEDTKVCNVRKFNN